MDKDRKNAIIVGALIIFAYAVLASAVIDSKIVVMIAEALSGLAVISIAVLMYQYFKPYSKNVTYGYVFGKIIEGGLMVIGAMLSLSMNPASKIIYDNIYIVHAYIFALSAFLFYYLLFKAKLIPNWLSIWGIIATGLLLIVNVLEILNIVEPQLLLYLPIILNEFVLAIWIMIKGFNISKK